MLWVSRVDGGLTDGRHLACYRSCVHQTKHFGVFARRESSSSSSSWSHKTVSSKGQLHTDLTWKTT
eukprot:scaffold19629_cov147-Amphora_coffeaeformis.AAC.6